ncbi:unnamed protein product [Polarella glacialis]|nr:unnamed protein product [Polarella glacialis]
MTQAEELEFFGELYAPSDYEAPKPSSEVDDEEDGHHQTAGADADFPGTEWMVDERASPLLAGSLLTMPRAFIAYAADDLLAKDSLLFADRLKAENGPDAVHLLHLQGPLGHGFAKHSHRPEAYAAVAAAGAFASGALRRGR